MEQKEKTVTATTEPSRSDNDLNTPKRVFGYCRFPSSRVFKGVTEEEQRRLIQAGVEAIKNATLVTVYSDVDLPFRDLTCHHGALRLSKKCKDGEVDLILAATPLSVSSYATDAMAYAMLLKMMDAPIQFTNGDFDLSCIPDRPWVSLYDTPDTTLRRELLKGVPRKRKERKTK